MEISAEFVQDKVDSALKRKLTEDQALGAHLSFNETDHQQWANQNYEHPRIRALLTCLAFTSALLIFTATIILPIGRLI